MQVKEIKGTIKQGTITIKVNTTESGVKEGKAIMDYYLQEKNMYQVFVYLQIKESDELYTIFDDIIECHYSKLEDWFKQCLKNGVKSGSLRKLFKSYDTRLNNGNTLQNYEIAESILLNSTECGYTTAVNWEILNLVFNDCINKKVQKISLSTDIIVRNNDNEENIEVNLIGNTLDILTLIKYLSEKSIPSYKCEITYDELFTSINMSMSVNDKQLVVNITIKHNNRLLERKLEDFIINKATKVTFINKENEVYTPIVQLSCIDALTIDNKLSLATGKTITQFTDMYWQNLGVNKQSSLF